MDDPMLMAVGILLVVLLTVATGYFVAQEFAYVSVDRGRLRQLADEGDDAAARAVEITGRLSFALSGAQFGITVTALLVGYAGEPLIGDGLADLLGWTGIPYAARLSLSVLLVLVFSTVLQMVVGELAPKNLAIARSVPLARALSRSTLLYLRVAGPVISLFDSASNRLLRAIGIEPVHELEAGATTEDLEYLVGASGRDGAINPALSALLDRGLAFRDLTAGQAMTPRVRVTTLSTETTIEDALVVFGSSGQSRFPVVGSGIDDVVGVVGLAEILPVPRDLRGHTTVGSVATTALVVPSTAPLPAVLETLRSHHRQLTVVVDEHGGFDGVLSLEDIAEEVVGDILDEDDLDDPYAVAPEAVDLGHRDSDATESPSTGQESQPRSATLSARLRLDEVESLTGLRLPEGAGYDTLGGLVLERLGRVTVVGDEIAVDESPALLGGDRQLPARHVVVRVDAVERHVPVTVTVRVTTRVDHADRDADDDADRGGGS